MNNTQNVSKEAEQSVVGGLLIDNTKSDETFALLEAGDFYDHKNKLIFETVLEVVSKNKSFDILTITQALKDSGKLEAAGGEKYIFEIAYSTPTALNILEYAKIVKQKSIDRQVISCAKELLRNPNNIVNIVNELKEISLELSDNDYPEPISLELPKLPELPPNILPSWFGEMIEAVAASTETPRELALMVGLAVLAICLQKKFVVEPESGYFEQLCIWMINILDVANRKSSVVRTMTQPLVDWEAQKAEELTPQIRKAKSLQLTLEKKISFLRKQAAETTGIEFEQLQNEVDKLENNMPKKPNIPRVWVQDVTPEKIGLLLADNDERMAVISAEGGLIDILAGRYNNNIPNLDIFLQSYSGDPVRVDRMGRDPIFMNNPALSMSLSVQPDVLCSLNKREFKGRGFLQRCLFAMPKSMIGHRKLEPKPIPNEIRQKYQRSINALLNLDQGNEPSTLKFSVDAYKEWKEFALFLERESVEGGRFENAKDLAGKMAGAAARLAGLLHGISFADNAAISNSYIIDLKTMQTALAILAVFIEHSLAVFYLMGFDHKLNDAIKVWGWIKSNKLKQFTARDCFNSLRGNSSFKHMDAMKVALDVLVERYYIFPKNYNIAKAGRPRSQSFIVNPKLAEGW
jgi:hypothetical protein